MNNCNINFLRMRVFEYSIKALDNQVIDQILESSNTQKKLIYSVISYELMCRTILRLSLITFAAALHFFSIAFILIQ